MTSARAFRKIRPVIAKHVLTHGGSIARGEHVLEFVCQDHRDNSAPWCPVWQPQANSQVAISLLNAPSGNGKTSFLTALYRRIRRRPTSVDFRFTPEFREDEVPAVAIIPQHSPMVRHWTVGELTSGSGASMSFLGALLPDRRDEFTTNRFKQHLGQFSGGQRYKLYTASALENLLVHPASSAFLLLDETFDGLGANEAHRALGALVAAWISNTEKPLNVLLVTHLADADLENVTVSRHPNVPSSIKSLRLTLGVEFDTERKKRVVVRQADE
jgi:ABC-type Mn2+/Zn2+ transport system ATPase subunit